MHPFRHTISVLRAGLTEDSYVLERDWTNPSVVFTGKASYQPIGGTSRRVFTSPDAGRETETEQAVFYVLGQVDVRDTDRVVFDGEHYQVNGAPQFWDHGSPRNNHTKVQVWRVNH
ncbi:hypothetical protein DR950_36125 [Kitasatospora xanthocidica]|uniref:Head-to-tail stopper n=1 Tax=Kitasatospora xanthocidica TaxID=83382 RepID=A0A373A3W4_9ACTN|nr:hypothetical protein [Kitasatospora xanthocidica]RGD62464.1 hypothetical protein DR950_36125 [Kitasatospora xanthocidica]